MSEVRATLRDAYAEFEAEYERLWDAIQQAPGIYPYYDDQALEQPLDDLGLAVADMRTSVSAFQLIADEEIMAKTRKQLNEAYEELRDTFEALGGALDNRAPKYMRDEAKPYFVRADIARKKMCKAVRNA